MNPWQLLFLFLSNNLWIKLCAWGVLGLLAILFLVVGWKLKPKKNLLVNIIISILALSILCWPYLFFQTFVILYTGDFYRIALKIFCWIIWSYPILVLLSIGGMFLMNTGKQKTALILIALPIISLMIAMSAAIFGIVSRDINKKLADDIDMKQIMESPQCPDGGRIFLGEPKYDYYSLNIVKSFDYAEERKKKNGRFPNGWVRGFGFFYVGTIHGHDKSFNFSQNNDAGQACFSKESCLEYIKQCRDNNNKTVFDLID